jgi:3-deoxy-manno-octulosonate cytidylyltransferase (CMP-KDO synthetase)
MNKGAVIIPARYHSTRFPGKPLADIHGKSMIQRVYEACVEAVGKELVYIATDSDLIANEAESFEATVIMTSEKCLTGTDRLAEVNEILELDFLVNVQGDEPMISPRDIEQMFNTMLKDSASVLCCYCDIDAREKETPTVPKVVVSNSSKLLYISRSGIPYDKELTSHAQFKQVCIYGFGRDHLKFYSSQDTKSSNEIFEDIEILRFLDFDIPVQMIKVSSGSYAVDTPEDLIRIRELMA